MPAACGWHYGYSVITAGGRVASCDAVAKAEHDMGEIVPRSIGFGDVWNDARYRKARAAVAESEHPDLADVDTLCTRCPYPKEVRHIYSIHDFKVLRQFQSVFQGKDPALEKGFDLFSQMRYGVSLETAADDRFALPLTHLFVGSESRNGTADFVEFIERNLPG